MERTTVILLVIVALFACTRTRIEQDVELSGCCGEITVSTYLWKNSFSHRYIINSNQITVPYQKLDSTKKAEYKKALECQKQSEINLKLLDN